MSFSNPFQSQPSNEGNYGGGVTVELSKAEGKGFREQLTLAIGTTIRQLFERALPGGDPSRYSIRVVRQGEPMTTPPGSLALQNGDQIYFTPADVAGA